MCEFGLELPFHLCDKVTHDRDFSAEKLFSLRFPANHRPDHPFTMDGDRRNSIIHYAGCLNSVFFNNQDAGNENGGAWAHPLHLDRNLDEGTFTGTDANRPRLPLDKCISWAGFGVGVQIRRTARCVAGPGPARATVRGPLRLDMR